MQKFDEELLEPIARAARFKQGLKHIPLDRPLAVVDLGCGPQIRFYHFAKKHGVMFKSYIGIDPLVAESVVRAHQSKVVTILTAPLQTTIPLAKASADLVTAFAFLEHINHPRKILAEAYRILKPGGKLILTTPTYQAKAVLEFLAFRLKIISPREIEEHKRYFDHYKLIKLLPLKVKRSQTYHQYFEYGMNNLLVITKPEHSAADRATTPVPR